MKTIMRSAGLALPIRVAIPLILGFGLSTACSGEGPIEVIGFGEAETRPFITFNKLKGGTGTSNLLERHLLELLEIQ